MRLEKRFFPSGKEKPKTDYELLKQAVKEYLANFKPGDFVVGSDAFVRTVIIRAWGKLRFNNLSPREFQVAKAKIKRILNKIEQDKAKALKRYIADAQQWQERELERSGGVDPNEI